MNILGAIAWVSRVLCELDLNRAVRKTEAVPCQVPCPRNPSAFTPSLGLDLCGLQAPSSTHLAPQLPSPEEPPPKT